MKGKTYYVIDAIMPWSTITFGGMVLGKDDCGSIGYCPVFTNKRKALSYAKQLGVKVRAVKGAKSKKGGGT